MISIIIPSYNSEKSICRALNSIINQTYNNFEIIIVDDGSTDNTKELIKSFLENKTVQYTYIYQKNSGPSSARNNGVINAKGEYIAFLDSDDEWHPQKLEIQIKVIEENNLTFLASTYQYDEFEDKNLNKQINLKCFSFNQLLIKTQFSTPGIIIKKDLFLKLGGFDHNMKYAEDNDLWLRLSLHTKLCMIREPKLVRLHKNAYGESGLSGNMFAMFKGELYLLKKLWQNKSFGIVKYLFLNFFTSIKFIRRLVKNFLK
jgi:glycosyltransferase involved in cell wall biosynthesis